MSTQRLVLGAIAVLTGLLTLFLATTDVHYTDRNCGTALFGNDPNKLSVSTGNLEQDEYTEQALIDNCSHLILGQRFLTMIPAAICATCIVAGRRLRARPEPRPGNIFGSDPN